MRRKRAFVLSEDSLARRPEVVFSDILEAQTRCLICGLMSDHSKTPAWSPPIRPAEGTSWTPDFSKQENEALRRSVLVVVHLHARLMLR
jgi:hypothetical protein